MNINEDVIKCYIKKLKNVILYIEDIDNFYILNEIKNKTNYLQQDNNLEKISILLIENLKRILIKTFRDLYYNIYKDNIFRNSFLENKNINIIQYHLKTFWNNLNFLNNYKNFNQNLKKIVKKNNKYVLKDNDNIDFQKSGTHMSLNYDIDETDIDIFQKLFDENISLKDINMFKKKLE